MTAALRLAAILDGPKTGTSTAGLFGKQRHAFLHTSPNCFRSFDDTIKPGHSCEHLLHLALYRDCLQHFTDGRLLSADLLNRFHYFTLQKCVF
jgi:hypothetical protein